MGKTVNLVTQNEKHRLPVHPWTVSPGLPWCPSAEEIPIGIGEKAVDPVSAGLVLGLLPGWMVVVVRRLREVLGGMPVMMILMVLVKMCLEMQKLLLLLVLMQRVIDVVQLLTEAEEESGMEVVGACAVTRVRFGTVRFRVQRGGRWRQGAMFRRSTGLACSCARAIQCSEIAVVKRGWENEAGRNLNGMRANTARRVGLHQARRHGRVQTRVGRVISSP